ncbi:MltA-interacting protein MipA [Paraperlucidibaca baekdonensis]|uniref:MltA-interacting protein MipA n=1 Tax=Paraperlucidibaca baekdonensis TaxID=748120 RepID=A0A3E0HA37_9GAMM|nr:cellulose biosynthesis protein BcsC [Paraperlucidibaca baekdonensis]REH40537.1 MltA-interacting protein MipA [Paraperlucidibaca baekdonensis]
MRKSLIALMLCASVGAHAEAVDQQLASVQLWLDKNRTDLAETALTKALLIAPTHAEALLLRVKLSFAAGQRTQAEAALALLAEAHPRSSALAQAQAYRRLAGSDGRDFATAEVMARTGRGDAAVAIVKRVFPNGPPGGDLSLRYFHVLASEPANWSLVTDGLRQLARQYPQRARYQQALAAQLASPEGQRRAQAAAEEAIRNDPFVIARERALSELDVAPDSAEAALAVLLRQRPADEATLAGLGRLRMRQGRHEEAVPLFSRALRANNPDRRNELSSLKRTSQFWAAVAAARRAESAEAILGATAEALAIQPHQADALNLRAQAFADQGNNVEAEAAWRLALEHTPNHEASLSGYLRWLANAGRLDEANALLAGADDQPALREMLTRVRAGQRRDEADAFIAAGDVASAEASLRAARVVLSDDPWLAFDLAKLLQSQQRLAEADAVMAPFARTAEPSSAYAYALFASSQGRLADAQAALAAVPTAAQDDSIRQYADDLQLRQQLEVLSQSSQPAQRAAAFAEAERLSQADPQASAAIAKALLQKPQATLPNGLAWMQARTASADPQQRHTQWQFALADVLVVADQPAAADALLAPYAAAPQRLTDAQYSQFQAVRIGAALTQGERAEAAGQHAQAFTWHAQAREREGFPVADANALSVEPEFAQTAAERALTRNQKRLDGYVHSALIYRDKSGDDGLSTTRVRELPTEIYWPVGYHGHALVRIDQVSIDAGTLSSDPNDQAQFGQVLAKAPSGIQPISQSADGVALGLGFETDHYRADIGTTPLGFAVTSLVGGLRYSAADATRYQSLELFRRPVQSSVLSYAGTRDPVSGRTWGGVVRTGIGGRLSHSVDGRTRAIGGRAAVLTGRSVARNDELRLSVSQSHDVIDRPNTTVNAGVALTYWRFAKDLSEFTFGHGGYYSPQQYFSVDFPVRWTGRWRDFAYLLEPSVGVSWASSTDSDYFPTDGALQAQAVANAANPPAGVTLPTPVYAGGSSGAGFSYSLQGALEKRVAPNWFVGGGFRIDRAEFYSPNVLQLYLRYEIKPKRGAVEYPPRLLGTYADF